MAGWREALRCWLERTGLKQLEARARPPVRAVLGRAWEIVLAMARDLYSGGLTLRTTSLVYTTLLSVVPLLAFSFSILKAFGVHNQLEPVLLGFLEPLGPRREALVDRMIGFVENIQVGVLGAVGLGFLMFTVGSLIYKIETGFNFIWDIRQARHWPRSVGGYLSVILGGPLLVFTATGMTASLAEPDWVRELVTTGPLGALIAILAELLPFLLVVAVFTFLYRLIPNTHVPFATALLGGLIAGILWQVTGWVFANFVATSTRYTAIYSGFAIGLMFMIWIYLSWLILLVGARTTFYIQHPEYLGQPEPGTPFRGRERQRAGLAVMCLVTERYLGGGPAWTQAALARRIGLPRTPLGEVLEDLSGAGLLAPTREEPPTYLPARDPRGLRIPEVLEAITNPSGPASGRDFRLQFHPVADRLLDQAEQVLRRELQDLTLAAALESEEGVGSGAQRQEGAAPS